MAMNLFFFETGTPQNCSLLRIFLKIKGLEFEMICWVNFVSNRFLSLRICKQSYHGTQFLQNIATKKPYIEKINRFFGISNRSIQNKMETSFLKGEQPCPTCCKCFQFSVLEAAPSSTKTPISYQGRP